MSKQISVVKSAGFVDDDVDVAEVLAAPTWRRLAARSPARRWATPSATAAGTSCGCSSHAAYASMPVASRSARHARACRGVPHGQPATDEQGEDSGLLTHLLNADADRVANADTVTGRAYESWVAMELARLLPHTDNAPTMRHWRNHHGDEVDIVLEDRRGRIVAIEIKAGATVGRNDLRAINKLRTLAAERFVAGLVLCTTRQTTPLGSRLWAVPIEALWMGRETT